MTKILKVFPHFSFALFCQTSWFGFGWCLRLPAFALASSLLFRLGSCITNQLLALGVDLLSRARKGLFELERVRLHAFKRGQAVEPERVTFLHERIARVHLVGGVLLEVELLLHFFIEAS